MRSSPTRPSSRAALPLLPIAAAYVVLAMVTPLSFDFIGNFVGPTDTPTAVMTEESFYAPWHFFVNWVYGFLRSYGLAAERPIDLVGSWYFQASPAGYLLLLTLKLPIIIFTLATGIVLYQLARKLGATADRASAAVALWLVNPLVIVTTVMWGTWDVVALFFVLLSMRLLFSGRTVLSAVSLLVGFGLRVIPILILPAYLVYLYRRDIRGFLGFAFTSMLSLAVGGFVVWWFVGERLTTGPWGALQIFQFYFPRFAGVTLKTVPFDLSSTVIALSLLILFAAKLWRFEERGLLDLTLAYFLVFFALAFWHPQYLIYLMGLATLDYALTERRFEYVTLVLTALGTSIIVFGFYFSSWGHSVFFVPNYNALMQQLSFFILMLPGHPIFEPIGVVLRSIFAAACLYYAVTIFLRNASRASVTGFTGQREATRSPDNSGNQVPPP